MADGDGGDRRLLPRRKAVRDLLWAAASPQMLSAERFPVLPVALGPAALRNARVRRWLAALDADPQPLLRFLREGAQAKSSTRSLALGVYFSALVEFWLRFCPALRVERFASGKPIVSATNQTVGQLKFLFRCALEAEDGALNDAVDMHVESSVKFFLLHPLHDRLETDAANSGDAAGDEQQFYPLEQFVGPHLAENLAWRVQEVARKLDMCRGPSVRAWLQEHYSEEVSSHIVLRGYLFYPLDHFRCTADVTRQHEWEYHQILRRDPEDSSRSIPPSHPSIARDHLCGWWTSNFEAELRAKVGANDPNRSGESRFVVLPKLHWLSPVIATEESESGRVFIEGETSLGAEEVEAMTLDSLVEFVNSHFEELANSPPDIKSNGAVAMPLFVAEIIRCQPDDREYIDTSTRWKELSRGFVLDPRCWDPVPLCREPVRFRRATRRKNGNGEGETLEREYEGRTGWQRDGVIKEEDLVSAKEIREPVFPTPEAVAPSDLAARIAAGLEDEQKSVPHVVLKAATVEVLVSRSVGNAGPTACEVGHFVHQTITFVIFEMYSTSCGNSKQLQRVGHLVLDALESSITNGTHAVRELFPCDELNSWLALLLRVAADDTRWDFLSLVLRALEIVRVGNELSQFGLEANLELMLEDLAARELRRWNAVVVEAVRVLYSTSSSLAEVHEQLDDHFRRFMAQEDWTNAERLATVTRNPHHFRTLLDECTQRNMTKAVKRLRKFWVANFEDGADTFERVGSWVFDSSPSMRTRVPGPSVDHARNREISRFDIDLQHWEYVDTTNKLQEVLTLLGTLEQKLQSPIHDVRKCMEDMLIGLDCEWRPQFLLDGSSVTPASDKETGTRSDTSENNNLTDKASQELGVSLYQIAIGDRVFVVDVQALGQPAASPLQIIWKRNSPFIVVGFCIAGDLKRLTRSFPDLTQSSNLGGLQSDPVELKRLAAYRQLPVDSWGLSRLYFECFGEEMSKDEQCSDWGARPLTTQQLEYAAMDAHSVRITGLHLLVDLVDGNGPVTTKNDLVTLMRLFAVDRSVSVWRSDLRPLGKADVHAALHDLGLNRAISFHTISKDIWDESPRHEMGLVVKSIAVVAKRGQIVEFAVVVLQLDRTIDMQSLADFLGVASSDSVSLAGQQTLLRVFGYSRGCVGPIGLRQQSKIRVVVDQPLTQEPHLLCGAGALDEVYSIAPSTLIAAVKASTAAISKE